MVGARIAMGLTQRQLAERLNIHESQVSRDERNEYHGVSVERAQRVLDAMKIKLRCHFESLVKPPGDPPPRNRPRMLLEEKYSDVGLVFDCAI